MGRCYERVKAKTGGSKPLKGLTGCSFLHPVSSVAVQSFTDALTSSLTADSMLQWISAGNLGHLSASSEADKTRNSCRQTIQPAQLSTSM